MARLANFRVRLVLGCPGLSNDIVVFRPVIGRRRSPTCPLCDSADEDPLHFTTLCPRLQHVRDHWLPILFPGGYPTSQVILDTILGVPGSDPTHQADILLFLAQLQSVRSAALLT